jgi:S-DNA-T family DNA segregation ATPase FtsK/SpoIIIE
MVPKKPIRMHEVRSFVDDLRFALGVYVVKIDAPVKLEKEIEVSVIRSGMPEELKWSDLFKDGKYEGADTPLLVPLGINEKREKVSLDIARMPHMLVGGRSFGGKTNFLHGLINALILRHGPEKVRLFLADPVKGELNLYKGLPHLLTTPISDTQKVVQSLKWAIKEMERRYDILEENNMMDIAEYHSKIENAAEPMPYIVFICDEFADVMSDHGDIAEKCMIRLAQMARAVGIHMILTTQSDEPRIVRGMLKANIPSRLAFASYSKEASLAILDMEGSENLHGWGLGLFITGDMMRPEEVQTGYIDIDEVKANVLTVKKKYKVVDENDIDLKTLEDYKFSLFDDEEEDELYEDAKKAVIEAGKASTSYIQRKLRVGYSRAARLIDLLEERGVVGPADGSSPREILED